MFEIVENEELLLGPEVVEELLLHVGVGGE
jgi:hypothetical protein